MSTLRAIQNICYGIVHILNSGNMKENEPETYCFIKDRVVEIQKHIVEKLFLYK